MTKLIKKELVYYDYKNDHAKIEYKYDDRTEIVDHLYYKPTFRELFSYPLSVGYREIKIMWYTNSKVREQFATFDDFLSDCMYLMLFDRDRYVTKNNRIKVTAVRKFIISYWGK